MKHQLAQYGKYTIYVVDGSEVRDSSKKNEDFGGSAIHIDFPKLIPENEIWIEDGVEEDERRFLIANALKRLQLLAKGYSKELSYDLALRTERDIRRNSRTDAHNGTVKVSQYYEFEGLKVYLVRGMVVRDKYKTDFIEGGHGEIYKWIPKNEIWLEHGLDTSELPMIMAHEYVEYYAMKALGYFYETAHNDIANSVEFDMRRRGGVSKEEAIPLAMSIVKQMHLKGK